MKWFRLYHEIIEDPKIGMLDFETRWLWIELLCLASIERDNGSTNMTVTETEWKLRRNIKESLQKLLHAELVTFQERFNGKECREVIFIPKWNDRQFQSDSSTKRVQKHREKQEEMKRYSNDDCPFQ